MATPTLSYPGVYVVEVPSGVHTITGVATSIAAFFGRASKGPMNRAVRLLSFSDYTRAFGKAHPATDLAQSVRQFFDNGGTDCYVVRVARNATKAGVTLRNLNSRSVLVFTAKAEGTWANTVRLEVDYNTANPHESFNLRVIQEEGGVATVTETHSNLSMDPASPRFASAFVSQSSDLVDVKLDAGLGDPNDTLTPSVINNIANSAAGFSQARRPLTGNAGAVQGLLNGFINANPAKSSFEISVNDSPFVRVTLSPVPGAFNAIASSIQGDINNALGSVTADTVTCALLNVGIGRLLTITAANAPPSRQASVRVRRASANDIAGALMLGYEQGGVEWVRWSNFRPAPTATILQLGDPAIADDVATLNAMAALQQNAIIQITLDGKNVPLNAPPNSLQTVNPGALWLSNLAGDSAETGDNDGVREKLRIIANAINASSDVNYKAEVWGYHLAIIAKSGTPNQQLTANPTGNGTFDNGLIGNVRQYCLGISGTSAFSIGGQDGSNGIAPTLPEYTGDPLLHTGFYALDLVDLFNLMIIPGDSEVSQNTMLSLWGAASTYSAQHRAFLLIDPPLNWVKNGLPDVVQKTPLVGDLRSRVVKENSAVFYPRMQYSDGGLLKYIGPAGLIAGLMSRTDSSRGVWKAPAGAEADLRGIADLEVNLTDAENGVLNKLAVNCLRKFPSGFVNWGARTLAGSDDLGSEWKYIPIRRLALFLEESLYRGTKWVVFEPNDEPLWAQIRLNLNAFMMGLFRQGAFQGSTPEKAFYVKCDGETTTADDRNRGIVNIEVGFAPLKPAEFVVIRIQQIADLK